MLGINTDKNAYDKFFKFSSYVVFKPVHVIHFLPFKDSIISWVFPILLLPYTQINSNLFELYLFFNIISDNTSDLHPVLKLKILKIGNLKILHSDIISIEFNLTFSNPD